MLNKKRILFIIICLIFSSVSVHFAQLRFGLPSAVREKAGELKEKVEEKKEEERKEKEDYPSVNTLSAVDIEVISATLRGELDIADKDSVDVFFRWKEKGEAEWMETSRQTMESSGRFEYSISGLNSGASYKFKAVVLWNGKENTGYIDMFTNSFDFKIKTTDNYETFAFYVDDAADFKVNWGKDEGFVSVPEGNHLIEYEYASAGEYVIKVMGEASRIAYGGDEGTPSLLRDILTPVSDGVSGVTSAYEMFRGATNISDLTAKDFLEKVSSSITDMGWMFEGAENFNQDIGGWDISNVENFTNFLKNAGLSTENYDKLLIEWSKLELQRDLSFHGGSSQYSLGAPADARQSIKDKYNWTIIDGGYAYKNPVTTLPAEDIGLSSATLRGEIDIADKDSIDVFFRWKEKAEAEWIETSRETMEDSGFFEYIITNLDSGMNYEFKAVAVWKGNILKGKVHRFTPGMPDGTEKWRFATEGAVISSPAIGEDGIIYVGSNDNNVYAVTPDGTEKWSFETEDNVCSSPAIGEDGTIYVGSRDENLYAINPNGTEKWRYFTGDWVDSSPAIGEDGTIYVSPRDENLYAINPDGTEKWRFTTGSGGISSPAIGEDGTIYVGSTNSNLYAINPEDGTEKWSIFIDSPVHSSPTIGEDGTIYVGTIDFLFIPELYSKLFAINPDGTEKWRFTVASCVRTSPVIGEDGTIYLVTDANNLYAINPINGTKKWEFDTESHIIEEWSSPAIAEDGTIYVGVSEDDFFAINPDGTEKWSFATGAVWSSPAIAEDGTIYVGSFDNNLYAINGSYPLAESPWPKHRYNLKNTGRK